MTSTRIDVSSWKPALILLLASSSSSFAQPPAETMNDTAASAEQVGAFLERVYKDKDALPPEGAKMLLAIAQGSQMRSGEGWFGPAQTRFDYAWLCQACKVEDGANGISRAQFPGSDPLVVDELSDPVGHAYSGMPARLYVVDTKGKVAFKSGRGPFGFSPPELEQALAMSLLEMDNVFVDSAKTAVAK